MTKQMILPVIAAIAMIAAARSMAVAEPAPQRIVSLNLCADQLLLEFVEPERIAALSPNAGDPDMAYHWRRAEAVAVVSGSAEEVLALEPDLVLAGPFAGAEAKAFLRSAGLRVVEVPVPTTLAEVAVQVREFGRLVGAEERTEPAAADFERKLARAEAAAPDDGPAGLYLQRRGIVTGHGTLIDDVMRTAGLTNVVEADGFAQYDLERLVTLDPEIIVLDGMPSAADQGAAMLLHPALADRFANVPRVVLSVPVLVCPGPWSLEAVRQVAATVGRVGAN